ncbi:DNA-directed RNA polymerase subunit alpha [candidate division WOR-3 bacterium]|nr:DNA-directed RNA polymerase subunit alpha [candidate division WOR-3 bacterium]
MKLLPFKVPEKVKTIERSDNYGKFLFSPLERGFGTTIGNLLRRTLLSLIQGSAITAMKIDGILHEFSSMPGVYEDVPEIILNLKHTRVKLLNSLEKKLYLHIKKIGEVKAGDIKTDAGCKIINPKQYILTVTEKIKPFVMELTVTSGRGYVSAELLKTEEIPIGTIFIDASYSPVKRVNYEIEQTRIGKFTDYEKLTLEVWTDGIMIPEDALALSALIMRDHLTLFESLRKEKKIEKIKEIDEEEYKLRKTLTIKIADMELSVRARNCLKKANIKTLGELVKKTEQQMLSYPNFGRKSLSELIDLLKKYNLSFGMNVNKLLKKKKNET